MEDQKRGAKTRVGLNDPGSKAAPIPSQFILPSRPLLDGEALQQVLSRLYLRLVTTPSGIQEIARIILDESRKLTSSRHGFVSAIDPITGDNIGYTLTELMPGECQVSDHQRQFVFHRGADGKYAGLWGHALNTKEAFFTNQPDTHPAKQGVPNGHLPIERFLAVPVLLGAELVGLIALANAERDYHPMDLANVAQIAVAYALAIQRARFEETIKVERDFSNAVLESAGALVAVVDTAGHLVRFNRACEKITGYTAAEVLGQRPFWEYVIAPNQQDRVKRMFSRLHADFFPHQHESSWLTKEKETRQISWTETALLDDRGALQYVVSTGIDITEQRSVEQAVRESSEQRRLALAAGKMGLWAYHTDTQLVVWDERGRAIHGYSSTEPPTLEQVLALIHEDDRERIAQLLKKIVQEGSTGVAEAEYRVIWPRGEVRWIAANGQANFQGEGGSRHVAKLVGTVKDITERKETEVALQSARTELELKVEERTAELRVTNEQLREEIRIRRETEAELSEAEFRYRTVANFTYDWEYWESESGSLLFCSPSCERISGYTADEYAHHPGLLHELVHPEDLEIWQSHRLQSLTTPGAKVVQFRIKRKDGTLRWLEHVCQPVTGPDGTFMGIRANNRDITQRIEANMERQRLREGLTHAGRVTTAGQFAASLAHELNQPLTAIHCNAEAAGRFLNAPEPNLAEVNEALADIRHDSRRAGDVIQRLRALFHKTDQVRQAVQLNEILQETIDLLHSEFVLKGVHVQLLLDPRVPLITGNRVEIQQVVLNLIMNAVDSMGSVERHFRQLRLVSDCAESRHVRVSVCDSGPGIPEELLERIFEPFFTTKAQGMGMGLVICRGIVEAHGGRLWLVNNPDRGITAVMTLPVAAGKTDG